MPYCKSDEQQASASRERLKRKSIQVQSNNLFEIAKRINRADDIAVYCHTNPDGDALGSMLALYVALKRKGKNVCAYCDTLILDKYKHLYASNEITFPQKKVHSLAVSVDCGDLDRLGQCMRSFLSSKEQIAIDHHKTFAKFTRLYYVNTAVSSCCEIVYELLKELKAIDKDVAGLLFSGIVTDSACFSFPSVTQSTFETASSLLKFGIDNAQIIYDMYKSTSVNKFRLKARVMSQAKLYCYDQIGIISFDRQDYELTETSEDDSEGIINELINIDSLKIAYSISQAGERNFKLSIRTKGNIDASEIAGIFGGGGHLNAAGCRLNGYKEDIIERLIKIGSDRI